MNEFNGFGNGTNNQELSTNDAGYSSGSNRKTSLTSVKNTVSQLKVDCVKCKEKCPTLFYDLKNKEKLMKVVDKIQELSGKEEQEVSPKEAENFALIELNSLQKQLQGLEQLKTQLQEKDGKVTQLQQQLQELKTLLKSSQQERETLQGQLKELEEQLQAKEREHAALQAEKTRLQPIQAKVKELEEQLQAKERELQPLQAKVTAHSAALQAKEREHAAALQAKVKELEGKLQAKEEKHAAALQAKEEKHAAALQAKVSSSQQQLQAKEREYAAALQAKEREYAAALQAEKTRLEQLQAAALKAEFEKLAKNTDSLMFRVFQALLLRAKGLKPSDKTKCMEELKPIQTALLEEGRWNALMVSLKKMLTDVKFNTELVTLISNNDITADSICNLHTQSVTQAGGGRTKKRRRSNKTKLVRRPQNRTSRKKTSRKRNKN